MKSKMVQKFQKNINRCDICQNRYNRSQNAPIIVCSMHHTLCRACADNLKSKPHCPFCRQKFQFDKVVVNNYIFELLPTQNNQKSEEKQHIPAQPSRKNSDVSGKQVDDSINNPINNRPLDHIYPPGYNPVGELDFEEVNSEALNTQNKHGVLIILLIQSPFTFCNLFFALTLPYSICMDQAQSMSFLVVRPWLLSIGIAEVVLMIAMLIPFFLFMGKCIRYNTLTGIWAVLGLIALLKVLIWAIIELQLFARVISHYCSGAMFIYGTILTIIHIVLLITLCCCSGSGGTI